MGERNLLDATLVLSLWASTWIYILLLLDSLLGHSTAFIVFGLASRLIIGIALNIAVYRAYWK